MKTLLFYQTYAHDCDHYHDPGWVILYKGKTADAFVEAHTSRHVGCRVLAEIRIADEQAKAIVDAIELARDEEEELKEGKKRDDPDKGDFVKELTRLAEPHQATP